MIHQPMIHGISLSLLLLLCGLSLGVQADQVDDYIEAQMREQHIPGLSIAVVKDGQVLKAKGYGLANIELNVPAIAETVYRLASLTKPFTATAIMLLVQDGKIGLDEKIGRYLENTPPNWTDLTVRHLLTHTSGIKDHLNEMNAVTVNGTNPEEISSFIGKMPLNFTPGTQSLYSNTNYLVLGIIIQKVSGKTYEGFLLERIFKPLGMNQTRINNVDEIIKNRAAGYIWQNTRWLNSPYRHPTLLDNADAGLVSSVLDMARWDASLYQDKILSADSRKQMWTPAKLSTGKTGIYGLGWQIDEVNKHRLILHTGNRSDTSTFIGRYVDDGLTVIVLSNLGGANPSRIGKHIAGLYVSELMPIEKQIIPDHEPEITAKVKAVILKIQDGTIDSEPFTAEMWQGMYPTVINYLRGFFISSGPLKSFDLVKREASNGKRIYQYRATFRDKIVIIDCTMTSENKISEMGVSPE